MRSDGADGLYGGDGPELMEHVRLEGATAPPWSGIGAYRVALQDSTITGFAAGLCLAGFAGSSNDSRGSLRSRNNTLIENDLALSVSGATDGTALLNLYLRVENTLLVRNRIGVSISTRSDPLVLVHGSIVHSTFVDNLEDGIATPGSRSGNLRVEVNIFTGHGGWAIGDGNRTISSVCNNLFWDNASGDVIDPSTPGCLGATDRGSLSIDPAYVDPLADDYHLFLGSPAIDTALDAQVSVDEDRDGNPRPTDGDGDGVPVRDIGAYEAAARRFQLRRGDLAAIGDDLAPLFPFSEANSRTPAVGADLLSGDVDPRDGILFDGSRPLCLYQVDPHAGSALKLVTDHGRDTVRFHFRPTR